MADKPDEKTPEQLRREGEAAAKAGNKRRNDERLDRLSAIADSAETVGEHVGDEEVSEEMWANDGLTEEQVNARAIARAAAESQEGDDQDDRQPEIRDEPANDQKAEKEADEAREAGADDVRVVDGIKQYRLVINGRTSWKTLAEIRATAQKVESADEYLQTAADTVRKATRAAPSPEQVEESDRKKRERLAQRKELLRRVALGDEQAIEQLAEQLDATPSAVTPDVLRVLDERFDSRVTFREAVTWFESEFSQELKHPAMKSYAGELDAALAQKDPSMPPKTRLKHVGEQLRRELKETYGLAASNGPSDKARRKAEVRRPTPAGERQPTQVDQDEVEDTSTVIQKIAQGRHQPRAVVHGPIRGR